MSTINKKALVTLAIGKKYEEMFEKYCKKNWSYYCNRHSYDLVVLTNSLDETDRGRNRSPAWQKLLILSQDWSSKYEQIVWVDTDIFINADLAPDIAENVPIDKVGAVDAYSIPSRELYTIALKRLYENYRCIGMKYIDNITPGLFYENRGIHGGDLDKVVQTGVFVCSPEKHRDIFEYIYYNYEDENKSAEWNYEMPAMSYELVKNDMVHWIPQQFNFCISDLTSAFYPFIFHSNSLTSLAERAVNKIQRGNPKSLLIRQSLLLIEKMISKIQQKDPKSLLMRQSLNNIYDLGYFIHFAGCSKMMEYLHQHLQEIK